MPPGKKVHGAWSFATLDAVHPDFGARWRRGDRQRCGQLGLHRGTSASEEIPFVVWMAQRIELDIGTIRERGVEPSGRHFRVGCREGKLPFQKAPLDEHESAARAAAMVNE